MEAKITGKGLSERQHELLGRIIQSYILTAEPVGSRNISKRSDLGLSAATIRNEMSDLEEQGFLSQPHTSAGRIPTDKGYRYYVDYIMKMDELSGEEKQAIDSSVAHSHDVDEILEIASSALSKVTRQLGVAVSPRFQESVFKKIDFVPLSSSHVLLVLALESGIARTMTIETNATLSPSQLATVCSVLNERLSGKRVREIQADLAAVFHGISEEQLGIIRLFIPSVEQLFEVTMHENIRTAGMPLILSQPEFLDHAVSGAIIELLEDKNMLIHLLARHEAGEGVFISIGGENAEGQFKSFSIVTSGYHIGSLKGMLGVIGPTRMPYPRLISAVDYTAKIIEQKHREFL